MPEPISAVVSSAGLGLHFPRCSSPAITHLLIGELDPDKARASGAQFSFAYGFAKTWVRARLSWALGRDSERAVQSTWIVSMDGLAFRQFPYLAVRSEPRASDRAVWTPEEVHPLVPA
jgi:hypothetical protein